MIRLKRKEVSGATVYTLDGRELKQGDEIDAELPMVGWVRGAFSVHPGTGAPLFMWRSNVARLDIDLVNDLRWPEDAP